MLNDQQIEVQSLEYSLQSLPWDVSIAIVSPTSISKMDSISHNTLLKKLNRCLFTSQVSYANILDKVLEIPHRLPIMTVIGIGGGTAIDYAKYVAKARRLYCIAIPSMLSTNAFATNKVAVSAYGSKHTEDGVLPDNVLLDWSFLNKSKQENFYGLVDVFSIYQALRDWNCADFYNKEVIDLPTYRRAVKLLEIAINIANSPYDVRRIFEVVREAGYITNDYGSGRPESGSEHIFASALESKIKIPHALAVTLGIHLMEFFSRYIRRDIPNEKICPFDDLPFERLGIIEAINSMHLRYDTIFQVVCNLQPRPDKFTSIDLLRPVFGACNLHSQMLRYLQEDCGFQFKGC